MTLGVERFGDVIRLRMTSAGSRMARMNVSAYVVRGVMIDTGFHRARRALLEAVRALGVRGAILTHWHEDHAGNVQALGEAGVAILAREDTLATLRARPWIRLYRRLIWGHPPALTAQVAAFDTEGLEGLHTPGHSPDHQVVWDARTRTVFSGDLWLGVHASILHEAEDPYRIVDSLRVARALEPERMFDAHRGEIVRPTAAIDAKIEWMLETLDTVARRLNEGWSEGEIVRRLLGGEAPAAYVSGGDYSRRNFVRAVRRRLGTGG
jgi:glyoxylase-like metal-dependent hydrolase (beta-lactamase superfamily II)